MCVLHQANSETRNRTVVAGAEGEDVRSRCACGHRVYDGEVINAGDGQYR